ncbi:MAG TPA: YraN family protein [Allosphingosinicella sp.]|uniref:YraN family protein n=1 Tax=Allosphingosinicella sp. TaxID=2823234 RepID=UPI002ED94E31
MKRQLAEQGGRRAEAKAALWLQMKGWRILGRRVRTPVGEVDLIARKGKVVAFIEVKARATMAEAEQSLDAYRLRRVAAAAEALLHLHAKDDDVTRIDAVYVVPGRLPRHLPNVWLG